MRINGSVCNRGKLIALGDLHASSSRSGPDNALKLHTLFTLYRPLQESKPETKLSDSSQMTRSATVMSSLGTLSAVARLNANDPCKPPSKLCSKCPSAWFLRILPAVDAHTEPMTTIGILCIVASGAACQTHGYSTVVYLDPSQSFHKRQKRVSVSNLSHLLRRRSARSICAQQSRYSVDSGKTRQGKCDQTCQSFASTKQNTAVPKAAKQKKRQASRDAGRFLRSCLARQSRATPDLQPQLHTLV